MIVGLSTMRRVGDKVKAGRSHAINVISCRAGAVVLPVSTAARRELGPTVSLSQDLHPSLVRVSLDECALVSRRRTLYKRLRFSV